MALTDQIDSPSTGDVSTTPEVGARVPWWHRANGVHVSVFFGSYAVMAVAAVAAIVSKGQLR